MRPAPLLSRCRGCRSALLALLLVAALLGACSDDANQGAVQAGNVLAPTATPAPRTSTSRTAPSRAPMPPHSERRRIYFTKGGDLWQLPIDNAAAPVISGKSILAYAAAPDGDEVIVAFQLPGDREAFAFVNADSTVDTTVTLTDASGTPVPDTVGAGGVSGLAWGPQGQTFAVARDDGSISVVDRDGRVKVLVAPHPNSHPAGLAWSPDGKLLSYLDPALPGRPTGLYTVPAAGGTSRLLVESGGTDQPVVGASWIAPGMLAYIQGKSSSVGRTGDLFAVDAASGKQRLLAGSSQFAPVGGVAAIAPSTDGDQLAFTIYVPGESRPRCLGLWLMDLESLALTQVPTTRDEAITDLWWASGALLFRSIPERAVTVAGSYTGTEPFAIEQLDPNAARPVERYRTPD